MEFIALDVETANADMASICQIGAARFVNGECREEWKTYINPQDYFDAVNISIHGIDKAMVASAPTFPEAVDKVNALLSGSIVVCHTHFDRVSLDRTALKYNLSLSDCTWLDSARVARRTWSEFARSGYGLKNVCKVLGYDFNHHDALEDAKAAGHIILKAVEHSGLDLNTWVKRANQPIGASTESKLEGNPEGSLYGEVIVFTGALQIPRREAATMAASIGCQVDPNVTKKTTLLIVGDQDIEKLAGHSKSSKHRKVEELILGGQPIRILRESDFQELVRMEEK